MREQSSLSRVQAVADPASWSARYSSKDYFTYELDFATAAVSDLIGAGAARVLSFQIDAENDFIWQKACYVATIADAAVTFTTRVIPLATVLIQTSPSQRPLMNIAVPVTSLFGTGEVPFILPQPRIFPARGLVTVTAQAFVAAGTTYRLRLSFIGTKLYLNNP